jgi:hypothetical protein
LVVKNLLFFQRVGWRKRLQSGFEHSELRTGIVAGRPGDPEFRDAVQNNRGGRHKRRHDRGEFAGGSTDGNPLKPSAKSTPLVRDVPEFNRAGKMPAELCPESWARHNSLGNPSGEGRSLGARSDEGDAPYQSPGSTRPRLTNVKGARSRGQ